MASCKGPTAILAHVVIWSDLGVPVFNFNIYLTGLDVARVDMRNVLTGTLPQSASAGQDPTDTNSPKGSLSQDINFASCNAVSYVPPVNSWAKLPPGALTAAQIANLQTSLTGQASVNMSGMCAGVNHGDNIARGYVTVDTVNNCTARFPGDIGYLAPSGSGDATDQSLITGEVFYVDQLHAIARSDNLVHIHASEPIRSPALPAITRSMGAMTASRPWITASLCQPNSALASWMAILPGRPWPPRHRPPGECRQPARPRGQRQ